MNRIKTAYNWMKAHSRYILPIALAAFFVLVAVEPSFAASAPTLDLDPDVVTAGLFDGANIILAALGAIMFLLAGFKLGGVLLRGIVDAIGGIRF
jgi:hypothetical protein